MMKEELNIDSKVVLGKMLENSCVLVRNCFMDIEICNAEESVSLGDFQFT